MLLSIITILYVLKLQSLDLARNTWTISIVIFFKSANNFHYDSLTVALGVCCYSLVTAGSFSGERREWGAAEGAGAELIFCSVFTSCVNLLLLLQTPLPGFRAGAVFRAQASEQMSPQRAFLRHQSRPLMLHCTPAAFSSPVLLSCEMNLSQYLFAFNCLSPPLEGPL